MEVEALPLMAQKRKAKEVLSISLLSTRCQLRGEMSTVYPVDSGRQR